MRATSVRPLPKGDPKIEQFLRLWQKNGRAQFQRSMPSHNYDTEQRKIARDRRQLWLVKTPRTVNSTSPPEVSAD